MCLISMSMCCVYMICAECNVITCVQDAVTSADFNSSLTCVIIGLYLVVLFTFFYQHVYALCKSG